MNKLKDFLTKLSLSAFFVVLLGVNNQSNAQMDDTIYGSENTVCERICNNLFNYNDRLTCASSLRFNSFDKKACEVCEDVFVDSKKITCVKSIANKYYSNFEIRLCLDAFYDDQKISCLKENGVQGNPYPGPSNPPTAKCDIAKLRRQVDGAISNFNGGNNQAGMNTLYNMKAELARCSK
jgi:hypothetical protein